MEEVSLILDTSFIIALNDAGDFNHKRAQSLKTRIEDKEFGRCCISDYIFDELMNLMMARSIHNKKIMDIGDALLGDETIELLKVDKEVFMQSWGLFKISSNLSFTDCTTIILAKDFNVKNIASFDSDFDRFNMKRIQK